VLSYGAIAREAGSHSHLEGEVVGGLANVKDVSRVQSAAYPLSLRGREGAKDLV